MSILVLDNYDSFTYNLVHLLEQYTSEITVRRNDEILIDQVEQFDKIVLSPGPSLPKDAGIMMQLIEKYHNTKSMLGICLGMQGIVQFFGGELFNLSEVKHGVTAEIEVDNSDKIFRDMPSQLSVGLYHSWGTRKELLPASLKEIAYNDDASMGIVHKNFNVRGVQFHPESIMTPQGAKIIENWIHHC